MMDLTELQEALEHLEELVEEYRETEEDLDAMAEDVDAGVVPLEDFQVGEDEADELVEEILALCAALDIDPSSLDISEE